MEAIVILIALLLLGPLALIAGCGLADRNPRAARPGGPAKRGNALIPQHVPPRWESIAARSGAVVSRAAPPAPFQRGRFAPRVPPPSPDANGCAARTAAPARASVPRIATGSRSSRGRPRGRPACAGARPHARRARSRRPRARTGSLRDARRGGGRTLASVIRPHRVLARGGRAQEDQPGFVERTFFGEEFADAARRSLRATRRTRSSWTRSWPRRSRLPRRRAAGGGARPHAGLFHGALGSWGAAATNAFRADARPRSDRHGGGLAPDGRSSRAARRTRGAPSGARRPRGDRRECRPRRAARRGRPAPLRSTSRGQRTTRDRSSSSASAPLHAPGGAAGAHPRGARRASGACARHDGAGARPGRGGRARGGRAAPLRRHER